MDTSAAIDQPLNYFEFFTFLQASFGSNKVSYVTLVTTIVNSFSLKDLYDHL